MIVAAKRVVREAPSSPQLTLSTGSMRRDDFSQIVDAIGLGSRIAQRITQTLSRSIHENRPVVEPWFALWLHHCSNYFDIPAAEETLVGHISSDNGRRLFVTQTYCNLVLSAISQLIIGNDRQMTGALFDWVRYTADCDAGALTEDIQVAIGKMVRFDELGIVDASDLLAKIYQEVLPPALRHLLGEYYTPSWLVEYCIVAAQTYSRNVGRTLTIMDPAVGSGGFLVHYISRLKGTRSPLKLKVVGFDVNPLAVEFCKRNVLIAARKAELGSAGLEIDLAISLTDPVVDPLPDEPGPLFSQGNVVQRTVLGVQFVNAHPRDTEVQATLSAFKKIEPNISAFEKVLRQYISDVFAALDTPSADIILGNPPWITWDGLTGDYRGKVAPQWANSSLVTNTGWKAKVAAGKTDFSSLFVYRSAQRHAKRDAIMAFVLPLSLFQSRLAGAGFRTFTTTDGRHFPAVQIDDFSQVKVFPDAVNRTAVGIFRLDQTPQFPITYNTWETDDTVSESLHAIAALAGPLDPRERNSPIIAFDEGRSELDTIVGKSDYRARGGVNTGGANTILWLEVLSRNGSTVTVRNVGKSRRSESTVITADVEKDAVHPLLCGTDIRRWSATPSKYILFLYAPEQPKKAIPIQDAKRIFPRAYDFVSNFKESLEARKEYHRWGCSGPFYELYRIGPYTFSPIKVVWQHTGYRKALNVCVIDDRNRQLTVPDQKAILIPFDDVEEAHYACAFLSASVTAQLLDRYLGTDASTHILEYVSLRRFDPKSDAHGRLADLSTKAHALTERNLSVTQVEKDIDSIAQTLVAKT